MAADRRVRRVPWKRIPLSMGKSAVKEALLAVRADFNRHVR
jgi:hypothetical protein